MILTQHSKRGEPTRSQDTQHLGPPRILSFTGNTSWKALPGFDNQTAVGNQQLLPRACFKCESRALSRLAEAETAF